MAGAMRVHVDARGGATWRMRAGRWRAHGLVGPGNNIGAVTHLRYAAPAFIRTVSPFFFSVRLCSCGVYPLQVMWQHGGRRIQSQCVHRVDVESIGSLIKHVR